MKHLLEVKERIDDFWSIESDDERDELVAQIRAYALTKDETELAKEIRDNFEQIEMKGISVIYEALSKHPEKWGNFFLEEYERAFRAAEKADNPAPILECLDEIGFAEIDQFPQVEEVIKFLTPYLNHQHFAIRFQALSHIADWIGEGDATKHLHLLNKMRTMLTDDPNWRVRYIARLTLSSINKLPADYKIRLWDKLLDKFLNPFNLG
ncbi:MAG: HEAT repeat domain-containing protein [Saprospiraceae bacterium]|nr:HEAT repeat domain-containing protein [Saprospiraceae bacterium]